MSADNGVYILESVGFKGESEYRVTHAQAIENIWWWDTSGNGTYPREEKVEMNPEYIKEYFGKSTVFHTRGEALLEADNILQQIGGWAEYGIQFLDKYPKNFPD